MTGPQRRNRLEPDALRRRVLELWKAGLHATQVAERLGYTADHIGNVARAIGVTFRTPARMRNPGMALH